MERNLCVLIDFENLATGCEKEGLGKFDLRAVMRRMKDKGRILVARAYADWGQWNRAKHELFEQGVAMTEMSTRGTHAKNRADMALCVDAMELAYTREFLDTFVILSGDSDFTPLVTRLKELNKRVIGCGTRGSSSQVFANLCDEFYFYETLKKQVVEEDRQDDDEDAPAATPTPEAAFKLLVETLENLQRDEASSVHGSVVKSSIKRKAPTFNEVELGFRTFTRFLEAAQEKGLVVLTRDEKAGGYRVELASGGGRRAAPEGAGERSDGGERRREARGERREERGERGERREEPRAEPRAERREEPRAERREEPRAERREEPRAERREEPREGEGTGRRRRRRRRSGGGADEATVAGDVGVEPAPTDEDRTEPAWAGEEAPEGVKETTEIPLVDIITEVAPFHTDMHAGEDPEAPAAVEAAADGAEATEPAVEEAPAKKRRTRTRRRKTKDEGSEGEEG